MNSSLTCHFPATNLTIRKILNKKEVSRTRRLPFFLKVLVVDDNKLRGAANAEIIGGLGHSVVLARDGITALRMAAANRPDAVLLNTNLAGIDDFGVAKRFRSDYPVDPPLIIGFASHTNSKMRWQCVTAGMDLVLEAPLNPTAIETLLLFECAKLRAERSQFRRSDRKMRRCTFQHNPVPMPRARPIERKHAV